MSNGNTPGFLVFDPAKAATSGAILLETGAGGGLIGGNGTFYSLPTHVVHKDRLADVVKLTGTIAGTLTVEVSNDTEADDRVGTSDWCTYDKVTSAGFTAGVATLVAGAIVGGSNPEGIKASIDYARYRLKLVVTSGTGTIKSKRTTKGSQ